MLDEFTQSPAYVMACQQYDRVADFLDLAGLPVEGAADHEKPAGSAQAVHLRDDRLGGGVAENHLVHGTENDTPLVHDACPPWTPWLCFGLEDNLAE